MNSRFSHQHPKGLKKTSHLAAAKQQPHTEAEQSKCCDKDRPWKIVGIRGKQKTPDMPF